MMLRCQKCDVWFLWEEEDQLKPRLCSDCFEDGLEDHEERKRERIARENEY